MGFKRVNVYVEESVHERVKAAVERLPGLSLSEVVRDCLAQMAPVLEGLADAVESESGARDALEHALGATLLRMALGEEDTG